MSLTEADDGGVKTPVSPVLQEWGWKLSSIFWGDAPITREITTAVSSDIDRATYEIVQSLSSPSSQTRDKLADFLQLLASTKNIVPQITSLTHAVPLELINIALVQTHRFPDDPGSTYILIKAARSLTDWTAHYGTPELLSSSLESINGYLVNPTTPLGHKEELLTHFKAPHYLVHLSALAFQALAHQNNLQNRQDSLGSLCWAVSNFVSPHRLPPTAKVQLNTLRSVLSVLSDSPQMLTPTAADAITKNGFLDKLALACANLRSS